MSFLYKADPERGAVCARLFAERAPDIDFRIWPDVGDPSAVEAVLENLRRHREGLPLIGLVDRHQGY